MKTGRTPKAFSLFFREGKGQIRATPESRAAWAVAWAVGVGLISGMGDGTVSPGGNASRAQVATILMRYCQNLMD